MLLRRRLAVLALVSAGLALATGPAWAHVTIDPGEATQGGFATVNFRVPNERDDAATTSVEVEFPADHPIGNARVQPVAGWTATVETDGDTMTRITWTGGPIQPGEFQQFPVSMGPLPDDTDELVFPAIQTYDSGEVVRWIDVPAAAGDEPEHPAPVLRLVAGEAAAADGDDGGDSNALAIVALVVGALGLLVGGAAFVTGRRRPAG